MKRVIAAASTALVIFGGVAACGSNTSNDTTVSKETQQETSPEPKEDAVPAEPNAEVVQKVPTLKVGETAHVKTTEYSDDYADTSKGAADVTLVSLEEYNASTQPNQDGITTDLSSTEEMAVVTLKIENTGSNEVSLTPYNYTATWTGRDGQVSSVSIGYADVPEDLSSTDSLLPGEHVQGANVWAFPGTQPGKLHFEDDTGKPLFDIATKGVA